MYRKNCSSAAERGEHPPTFVFEYSSRSTASYDQTTKADTYMALGVRELWLIDSDGTFIEGRNARTSENQPLWEIRRYKRRMGGIRGSAGLASVG
jgi:Uma2 family endonuclease